MREYELILIVHPDLEETALNDVIEKVKGWIVEAGGSIAKVDFWGKRKLAYTMKKQKDGHYVLAKFQMPPDFGSQLERNLRFLEPVMRFLITQL
jgi:small subunit ribosomal protein S6